MPAKNSIKKRPVPPPRTIMGAFDLLRLKGEEANLSALSTSQRDEVLRMYVAWKIKNGMPV